LESAGKQVSLQGFGFADLYGHTGIFQGAHAASVTYTIAVIILINKLFLPVAKKNYFYDNRFYNVILIAIGTYSIFAGFVRTGYLMFLVSILVFVFSWFKFTPKQLFTIAATIFLLFVGIFYLIQTNDVFSARLFDQRVYGSSSIGSGRLIFWKNAYECWSNGNALEMLFGIGIDNFKNYQYEKIGLKIFSHSQFFDSLVQNGIFGILLYLFMLSALFSFIRKRKKYVGYSLALSLFSAYLMFALVQGSSLFFPDLMFALSLAYLFSSSQHSCLIVSHKL
jgi:O-antigen ligase